MSECDKNTPRAFAFMRSSHDAFRAYFTVVDSIVNESLALKYDFSIAWANLRRCVAVHSCLEEIDLYPILNKLDSRNKPDFAKMFEKHQEDQFQAEQLTNIIQKDHLTASDISHISELWKNWKEHHLNHFLLEEEILVSQTPLTAPTALSRCVVVHKHIITPAYRRDPVELTYYIGWCVRQLSMYGSTKQGPNEATAEFVRALQYCCLAKQWQRFAPICRAHCKGEVWKHLVDAYKIEDSCDAHIVDAIKEDALATVAAVLQSNMEPIAWPESERTVAY